MLKKINLLLLLVLTCVTLLVLPVIAQTSDSLQITFWTRPNPLWVTYWEKMAEKYNATTPVVAGKNVVVEAVSVPAKPDTETAIQMSIAAGTVVQGSENLLTGFVNILAEEGYTVPLDELPGFLELMGKRGMADLIKEWTASDGHIYLIPNFSNPKLFAWRIDILRELGFETPPGTYCEALELGEQIKKRDPDKFLMVEHRATNPSWSNRWGDFFPFYYANTSTPFITGNILTADDKAAIEVFKFFNEMYAKRYLLTVEVPNAFDRGVGVWQRINSWAPLQWKESAPNMVLDRNYSVTGPLQADENRPGNFFTDEKGMAIFAQSSSEEREAIWDFYKFVLSDPANDLIYFQMTGVLPVRGDLTVHPELKSLITPETTLWAGAVSTAIPSISHEQFAKVMEILGTEGFIPALRGEKDPEKAWADTKALITALLK